ncbi:hypothetical protein HYH02_011265 [Chlamydomonas schloesseri]|uniref:Uncharacterized protein n=1 Tax=Chlamydomonas schloesseri TaxID=2026947 RepID=A0A835T583_9CHLO|nr:hypothetical protein HYH02_011265 [Chlamydomonas schloesseri]|eukprot:KAG2437626.1 hypothetical protein HYH02_011265 [Chlamydomonas schloesseri]
MTASGSSSLLKARMLVDSVSKPAANGGMRYLLLANSTANTYTLEQLLTAGGHRSTSGDSRLQVVDVLSVVTDPLNSTTYPNTFTTPGGTGETGGSTSVRYSSVGSGGVGGLDAAWRLTPGATGDYLLRLKVANQEWWRWVAVDIDPPRVSGHFLLARRTNVTGNSHTSALEVAEDEVQAEVDAAHAAAGATAVSADAAVVRLMLAVLSMSEPVQTFSFTSALRLSGGARLISAQCFASASAAEEFATAACTTTVDIKQNTGATRRLLAAGSLVSSSSSNSSNSSAMPYVQSCVVVLFAEDGSSPELLLPAGSLSDLHGNTNTEPLILSAKLMPSAKSLSLVEHAGAPLAAAVAGGVFASATFASASASFLSAFSSRSSLLQSGYHIQDLLYTLAIAALLMTALVVAHLLLIGLWRLLVAYDVCGAAGNGGEELHPVLRFPRAEMVLGGLLLVALTFYSALTLNGVKSPRWGDNSAAGRLIAVLVLAVLVVPYGMLLWWLTACRWYLEEQDVDHYMLGPHWRAFEGAMPCGGAAGGSDNGISAAGGCSRPSAADVTCANGVAGVAFAASQEHGAVFGVESGDEGGHGLGPHWALAPAGAKTLEYEVMTTPTTVGTGVGTVSEAAGTQGSKTRPGTLSNTDAGGTATNSTATIGGAAGSGTNVNDVGAEFQRRYGKAENHHQSQHGHDEDVISEVGFNAMVSGGSKRADSPAPADEATAILLSQEAVDPDVLAAAAKRSRRKAAGSVDEPQVAINPMAVPRASVLERPDVAASLAAAVAASTAPPAHATFPQNVEGELEPTPVAAVADAAGQRPLSSLPSPMMRLGSRLGLVRGSSNSGVAMAHSSPPDVKSPPAAAARPQPPGSILPNAAIPMPPPHKAFRSSSEPANARGAPSAATAALVNGGDLVSATVSTSGLPKSVGAISSGGGSRKSVADTQMEENEMQRQKQLAAAMDDWGEVLDPGPRGPAAMIAAPPGTDKRLLPLYPGKELPMYRLSYRAGCWPLRLRLAPPVHFLARFEFLFEDAVGEGSQEQRGRETKWILSATAINFSHKALCAAAFGGFGHLERSACQLGFLMGLQGAMLLYLAMVRPFRERLLQAVELICHALEAGLFACAVALLNAKPDNGAATTFVMVACFFGVALLVIVYEP